MQQLSEYEQVSLLKEFPRIELSYETHGHKKVYPSDFVIAVPRGQKCFAWFTVYKTQNVCILLEIGDHKKINKVKMVTTCFHSELSYGTVFYGTLFYHQRSPFFTTEDLFYYKGKSVFSSSFDKKLSLFHTIFSSEIKQYSYFHGNIVFGLPLIARSYAEIYKKIIELPYPVKHIHFVYHTNKRYIVEYSGQPIIEEKEKEKEKEKVQQRIYKKKSSVVVFKVKPDIQNDIYHLYYADEEGKESYFDIASIPDYKTSVMMNTLFRTIKENINLDSLEESDEEEEFENDQVDKFVFLQKELLMVCTKQYRFHKWFPIRIASPEEPLSTKRDVGLY